MRNYNCFLDLLFHCKRVNKKLSFPGNTMLKKRTKKDGVEMQLDAWKTDENTKVGEKNNINGNEKRMGEGNFYMRVYDDAVSKKNVVDNIIIE